MLRAEGGRGASTAPAGEDAVRFASVVVIGAGQAGLSAGHHLARHGYASALTDPGAERSFVILDAERSAGGAWQHRWRSLTMETVNGIFDLPGFPKPPIDAAEPSRDAVPRYFAAFEEHAGLPILRPVAVTAVRRVPAEGGGAASASPAVSRESGEDASPANPLDVETTAGRWRTRAVINATGTWGNPVLPRYPGQETFRGRQLHTRDYVSAEEFAGLRVAVVGGGISALQQLEEISRVATVLWYTRREPVFREGSFRPEAEGREVIEKVADDAAAGNPTGSVVSYTGLLWTPYALAARRRGALDRRPMFAAIEPHGVREADGSFTSVDVILWATGFKAALSHLDPLGLRNERGGIALRGTQVAGEPRVHLIGYGPSQSTVGANRAGRDAVRAVDRHLGAQPAPQPAASR
ncbi:NAD(P)-binding domain-containing protein [Rothia halotolerans]|uniref:NAD(P)-binding domain-containing protein n=1 Tax=Rothia halotolerans TaxID=405770 RepID=UPI00101CC869|nr:NAD(P)-binding domain-containing protein [Rothia halotolerans]